MCGGGGSEDVEGGVVQLVLVNSSKNKEATSSHLVHRSKLVGGIRGRPTDEYISLY